MPLAPGTRLGLYEITGPLGAGGMGEVYRARDTRLGREVALKVLPDLFARDPERLARFQQEARLLAALNHPHIAAIYGLEEAVAEKAPGRGATGAAGPIRFLVLELVPGETLAERIARGALPVDEALAVCRQIAEGLEAAHERGIIHRDLKPTNIKVTPEEQVKVLDFGLGKAFGPREVSPGAGASPGVAAGAGAAPGATPVRLSESPTETLAATREGMILGTASYMSPEQARGKPVDKRADIWAFGCVLYECLTGKQAFAGETVSDTIARILERDPDWSALPGATPWFVRGVMRRCLEKDVRRRSRDIGDVLLELEQGRETWEVPAVGFAAPGSAWRRALPWCLAALLAAVAGAGWWQAAGSRAHDRPQVARFSIHLPPGQHLPANKPLPFAVSEDGSQMAYVAQEGARSQIYVRRLDSYEARPIPGTERAVMPFFSPDGRWLAFFADRQLKKVPVAGGAPTAIASAPDGWGGTWGRDDTIVFVPSFGHGLTVVSAAGGAVRSMTHPDSKTSGFAHMYPQFLPDGRGILFGVWGGTFSHSAVLSPETGDWQAVPDSLPGIWSGSGHLLFPDWGGDFSQLLARRFDTSRLIVSGPPAPVLNGISCLSWHGTSSYRLSRNGTLVYVPGSAAERTLVWRTPDGSTKPLWLDPADYTDPRISPAGDRVAVNRLGALWVIDIRRGSRSPITQQGDFSPVWTPDGREITYSSARSGIYGLYSIAADGSGHDRVLFTNEKNLLPYSWSPDGTRLLFDLLHPEAGSDIWQLDRDGKAFPFVATPFNEHDARFSPDGRFIAFASDESGKEEVYVQAASGSGAKWAVSIGGGTTPVWSRDGRSIYYHTGDDMMEAGFESRPALKIGTPRTIFSGGFEWDYGFTTDFDVAPDGSFLLIRRPGGSQQTELRVVLNWFEELNRLVPPGKH